MCCEGRCPVGPGRVGPIPRESLRPSGHPAGAIAGAQSDGERGLVLETHRVTSGDLVDTTQPVTNGVGVQEQFAGGVDERPVGGQEGPKSTHVLGAPVVVQALEWVDELVLERGQPAQGKPSSRLSKVLS